MSALVAGLALVTALSRHHAPAALVTQPIQCAPNDDIADSGCGHVGSPGASGFGQVDSPGASGFGNLRSAGASGTGHVDSPGASGCFNTRSPGASGSGHVDSPGASGGNLTCTFSTIVPPPPPTTSTTGVGTTTTTKVAPPPGHVVGETLPLTGHSNTAPLALAVSLMLSGAAAVGLANRRRHALAVSTGGELMPMPAALGLLLTGRAKTRESQDPSLRARAPQHRGPQHLGPQHLGPQHRAPQHRAPQDRDKATS